MAKHVEGNLVVHGGAGSDISALPTRAVLGRHGGNGHQPSCSLLDLAGGRIGLHIVQEEVGGSLQHRVVVGKKLLVPRVEIVLPDVGGEPGAARGEHAPRCAVDRAGHTPQVSVVMSHPATTAVHIGGGLHSRLAQVAGHREQRLLRLGQVANEGGPVVHLGVDIDGVFRVPRGIDLRVPYTLQVGGLAAGLRRGDEQVTAVLHHQRHHVEVAGILFKGCHALVGLQGGVLRLRQGEHDAVVLLLVFLQMGLQQLVVALALDRG